jgi:hemoglobin
LLCSCVEGSKQATLPRAGTTRPATEVAVKPTEPDAPPAPIDDTKPELVAPPTEIGKSKSLYQRLGGGDAITKVVDDFVAIVAADDNIKEKHRKHFMIGDVAALKKKLVDQVGEATGGPQKYTGKNMKDAHKGLEITNKDFDALVADLVKALDKNGVAEDDKKELLTMLGTMRKDVVEKED